MKLPDLQKSLSPKRAIIPIIIGLSVVGYFFFRKYDINEIQDYNWGNVKWFWVLIGLSVVVFRHLGYMYRIRVLTDYKLSWPKSFSVISLWEFASSISPSAVGGTAVSMIILVREKISLGRSTAIAITTLFLDLLYFLLCVPVLFFIIGRGKFFGENVDCIQNSEITVIRQFGNLALPFMIAYIIMLTMFIFLGYGLFRNPRNFKYIIVQIFRLPFLRKFKKSAAETGSEVITASKELSGKPFGFWGKAFAGTALSWTARFFLINCLVLAFSNGVFDQIVLFARYFLLWAVLVIPSTPGASGLAEFSFSGIFCQFLPSGAEPVVLVIWRLLSYYFYLILGIIVLPRWLKRVLRK